MDQQNQGLGSSSPSNIPAKRKRGRPRKEGRTAQPNITPVTPVDIVINPSQTGTTGSANDEMLGRVVTGVIEGCFGGGYLLNVRIGDSSTCLRGVLFQPGKYVPVTPENDVAPHLEMIQRVDFPVPVLNPQAQMQSSIPSAGQGSRRPVEPQPLVIENQSASVLVPMINIPTCDSSIPAGGIPQTVSDVEHGSQSASIMKMECDKTIEQDANKLDTSRQVKELGADGGTEKDSNSTAKDTNLLPTIEQIDKELQIGLRTGSSVQLNEQVQDQAMDSAVELNHMPAPAGPEPIQSEQVQDEPMKSSIEVNELPVSVVPEAMQSEQIHEPRNLNMEPNEMPVSAEREAMQSEQIHEPRNLNMELNEIPVPAEPENVQSVDKLEDKSDSPKPARAGDVGTSESRFGSEGSNLPETNDPRNHGPSGETAKEDDIQPSVEITKSGKPENPIGPDIL